MLEIKRSYEAYKSHIKTLVSCISLCYGESDLSFIILVIIWRISLEKAARKVSLEHKFLPPFDISLLGIIPVIIIVICVNINKLRSAEAQM